MSFTENVKNLLSWVKLKCHLSIGDFDVYNDTGSPVPNIPSKSHGLTDEKTVFDGMEMIRNNRIHMKFLMTG
jgi:hypothetical protein